MLWLLSALAGMSLMRALRFTGAKRGVFAECSKAGRSLTRIGTLQRRWEWQWQLLLPQLQWQWQCSLNPLWQGLHLKNKQKPCHWKLTMLWTEMVFLHLFLSVWVFLCSLWLSGVMSDPGPVCCTKPCCPAFWYLSTGFLTFLSAWMTTGSHPLCH